MFDQFDHIWRLKNDIYVNWWRIYCWM